MTFLPVLTITDDEKVVKEFDSFSSFYVWATNNDKETLGAYMGNATVVFLFGIIPLRYDRVSKQWYKPSTAYKETSKWSPMDEKVTKATQEIFGNS